MHHLGDGGDTWTPDVAPGQEPGFETVPAGQLVFRHDEALTSMDPWRAINFICNDQRGTIKSTINSIVAESIDRSFRTMIRKQTAEIPLTYKDAFLSALGLTVVIAEDKDDPPVSGCESLWAAPRWGTANGPHRRRYLQRRSLRAREPTHNHPAQMALVMKGLTHMTIRNRPAFFALLCATLSAPLPAWAQDITPEHAAVQYVAQQPTHCDSKVRTYPTAIGVSVSALGFIGGSMLMASGVFDLDGQRTAGQKGLIASGSILMGVSIAGVVTSAIYLHRAKERKAVQRVRCMSLLPARETTSHAASPVVPGLRS